MSELTELYRKICKTVSDIINAESGDFLRFLIDRTGSELIGDRFYWYLDEYKLWLVVDYSNTTIRVVNNLDEDINTCPPAEIYLVSLLSLSLIAATEEYSNHLVEKMEIERILSLVKRILESPFLKPILLEVAFSFKDNVLTWFVEEVGAYARIDLQSRTIHILLEPSSPLTKDTLANSFAANLIYEDLSRYMDSRLPQLHAPSNKIYFGPFSLS